MTEDMLGELDREILQAVGVAVMGDGEHVMKILVWVGGWVGVETHLCFGLPE